MSAMSQHILIMIAMEAEARPLLDKLGFSAVEIHAWAPCKVYSGTYKDTLISVVTNGQAVDKGGVDNVGTNPATLSTFCALSNLSTPPTMVLNAGTAGGFSSKGAEIGDAFISTDIRHHDRRITIPGWDDYAKGHHKSMEVPNLIAKLGFKSGVVTTGNSLDATDIDRQIMQDNDASVKDMEAAAIAWVCEQAEKPFFALKIVTDIVDGTVPTNEEFMANLGKAAESLQKNLMSMVDFIAENKGVNL